MCTFSKLDLQGSAFKTLALAFRRCFHRAPSAATFRVLLYSHTCDWLWKPPAFRFSDSTKGVGPTVRSPLSLLWSVCFPLLLFRFSINGTSSGVLVCCFILPLTAGSARLFLRGAPNSSDSATFGYIFVFCFVLLNLFSPIFRRRFRWTLFAMTDESWCCTLKSVCDST